MMEVDHLNELALGGLASPLISDHLDSINMSKDGVGAGVDVGDGVATVAEGLDDAAAAMGTGDTGGGAASTTSLKSEKEKHENMKILADGKVMKVQKTRQRKILSCVYCHSKKIKCSRSHPICNNCEKLGIECKYFINERVSRGGKKSAKNNQKKTYDDDLEKRSSISSNTNSNHSPISPKLIESVTTDDSSIDKKLLPDLSLNNYKSHSNVSSSNGSTPIPVNFGTTSLLQTPVLNTLSNNITNNFFNTNYSNNQLLQPAPQQQQQQLQQPQQQQHPQENEEYSFNLSSFTYTGETYSNSPNKSNNNSSTNINSLFIRSQPTNFLDNIPASTSNHQPNNPGLHNSLNAYSSNPATTTNYLYGTNTYYDNDNLLNDLLNHLPQTKERSYELLNRYINSVHILLPIMIKLDDFIKEHDNYWNIQLNLDDDDNLKKNFDYLQFYTLYFPILYASTISEFEEYDNLLLNQDINKYLKGFNKICQYFNYPHGLKTIPLLLGNVIIQSTSPNPSTMEMSHIIRYAKFLQMHKDPINSLRINDWEVIKFRRLIWWVIFGLDALTSHNFCLPPICKFDDFNVLLPDDEDPVYNESGMCINKKLDITMLSMNVKFKFDRILSELVYQLHNGFSNNITSDEINHIKSMIIGLFHFIHQSIVKMSNHYKVNPPQTVQEMNLINFIKNHSWSFVDRSLMLLHKKILMRDSNKDKDFKIDLKDSKLKNSLSFNKFEDTFGNLEESNIIKNFDNSSISQLRFNQYENFTYENLHNNLIPSILHNLNDFLKYNDFIKFGKFNWYVKRTIPLDSIILLFIIICVKFKYEFMTINELIIYVKLINKALFILNRKWFKNEKYKRMLSLTNLTWQYILKKYNIIKSINHYNQLNNKNPSNNKIEFFDYQVTSYMNMSELFNVMDVPQPILMNNGINLGPIKYDDASMNEIPPLLDFQNDDLSKNDFDSNSSLNQSLFSNRLLQDDLKNDELDFTTKLELLQMNEKIYYDLRNNFVDINDYCAFYSSLENVLHELMDYIHKP